MVKNINKTNNYLSPDIIEQIANMTYTGGKPGSGWECAHM
jgi:hypothetical protein